MYIFEIRYSRLCYVHTYYIGYRRVLFTQNHKSNKQILCTRLQPRQTSTPLFPILLYRCRFRPFPRCGALIGLLDVMTLRLSHPD